MLLFFWVSDLERLDPLFFREMGDEHIDILATSYSIGTPIIGDTQALPLEISCGTVPLCIIPNCPTTLSKHSLHFSTLLHSTTLSYSTLCFNLNSASLSLQLKLLNGDFNP